MPAPLVVAAPTRKGSLEVTVCEVSNSEGRLNSEAVSASCRRLLWTPCSVCCSPLSFVCSLVSRVSGWRSTAIRAEMIELVLSPDARPEIVIGDPVGGAN